ncbi:MAG: hypothetical protein NZO58_03015, partial [Gemmataceae bacterium]|nr:hypothetical protein [Gemmataceae bacterium]
VCSGTLVLLGLGWMLLPLPRWLRGLMLGAAVLGALAVALRWRAFVPALLYGCQPGAVVLLGLLGLQRLLQERYRRQVVFMPGFAQWQEGSSLSRRQSGPKPREPSTVDAPPLGAGAGPTS